VAKTKLLICEGAEDAALAIALQSAGAIPSDILIKYIGEGMVDTGYGIDGLKAYLEGLPGTTLLRGIKSLGIFVDNDITPDKGPASKFVQNAVREANKDTDVAGRYSVPTAPHSKASNARIHTTLILASGGNAPGCLETLLVQILGSLYATEMKCVEQLLQCGGVLNANPPWTASKLDKARLRAAIAILHRNKPQMPLASLWNKAPNVIPIGNALFGPLARSLSAI
jgi:hypothetical protein